ncbi:hypothetical protein FNV43_RR05668 [Rhamnella rubrinervis]|uniref:RRM domain-containing protein n=1 Tax=Rhamnella rubrinervis TaxID=2594499 RepID=A0A8K0HP80_9ROSA|nr:hypothetical protein FNV43_RR05668 [Rhamnella rubrinervis]
MAKKRKLRSSEPETTKAPEPQPEQPPPPQPDQEHAQLHGGDAEEQNDNTASVQTQEDELQGQQDDMAVDDTKEGEEDEPTEEQVEEEEEEQQNETLDVPSNGAVLGEGVQAEANEGEEGNEEEDVDDEPLESLLEPFSKEQLLALVKQAADKYPDFVGSVRELADADPAHRKIFVHGLGWDTTAETLTSVFGSYGEIEDCKAVTDKVSGKSKGYAFILFRHRSGARKALKEPQKKIGNRTTSCQLASTGPVPAPPPMTPPVSEYTQRKIFVSNVSAEIDVQKLLEFFKQFGEVEEGPLGLDKQTGKPKGFALFVYRSVEGARKALEEPYKVFEGHTLHCQKAIDGPKPNKPYHHHHQPPHYHSRKEKNKYSSGGGAGAGAGGPGHLMAPSAPAVGFNPGVAAPALNPALGQALTALLATQGAGLGIGNLLGGLGGAPVNQAGPPAGYGNQASGSYGNQPMQGGYQNPQMGQSSAGRPHPGAGAPYMGH